MAPEYKLIYWPTIPGRGEPIRLFLEQQGVEYEDVALTSTPEAAVGEIMACIGKDFVPPGDCLPPFAPPILVHKGKMISQSPNIMLYLAHQLTPDVDIFRANQLFLTLGDLQNEAHDTHHPIATGDYYEDQKEEALKKAKDFKAARLPKFLNYIERVLQRSNSDYLLGGETLSYPDLMLAFVISGVKFAFPNATQKVLKDTPLIVALCEKIESEPKIKSYLESDRRMTFSNGIYRYYKELDDEEDENEKEVSGRAAKKAKI